MSRARHALIEDEAKRRCLAGGYTLDTPAKALTSFDQREGPLWKAYVPRIEAEIEKIEAAGFEVRPGGRNPIRDRFDIDELPPPPSVWFWAGVALVVFMVATLLMRWGN